MLKKVISAAAAAVALMASGAAMADTGFESGTADWVPSGINAVAGALTTQAYGSTVAVTEDLYDSSSQHIGSVINNFTVNSAGAGFGSSFGVLSTAALTDVGFRVNLLTTPATAGDVFAMQLFTYDYDAGYDDTATVSFYNGSTLVNTYTWSATDTVALTSSYGASGWLTYGVDAGVTSITVQLENVGDPGNPPVLALDYAVATPVPEPESLAMMMAGLGALGFMARRRTNKSA